MIKTGNYLFFLTVLFCGLIASANTLVQSTVDRNEVGLGDTFNLTVTVTSTDDVGIQEPRIPELDGFDLLNSSQSTAVAQKLVRTERGMQFETQRRKDFIYALQSNRSGTLSVGSFEVVIDGKVHRTQPIVIKVGAQGSGQQAPGRQRPTVPGFEDPFEAMDNAEEEIFNQLLRQRQRLLQQHMQGGAGAGAGAYDPGVANAGLPEAAFRSLPTNPNEAFFISVEVDKTEVYEGEQVTVNWYVYTRGQMETLDRLKFPSLRGFWKEIIEEVPSIQFSEEIVNGVPWKKALLASHALFPIKAGTAVIDEYKIKSRVRTLAQGAGYFGKAYEYTKSSSSVELKVKPLPVEGRPSDFTGAVGIFEVNAGVENPTVPVNQPFSLKVRFEGAGNAKVIDLPALNLPAGLEQYDTKSDSKFFKNGRSYKEFEVLLIPRQEGEIDLPAMSISMFDPSSRKYYTKTTQSLHLKIVNNPNAPVGSSQRLADTTKATPTVVENILPSPVMGWQPSAEASLLYRPWLWAVVYGMISALLLWKSQREFGWGRRRRTLREVVQKRYKAIDGALAKSDYRKVGTEMTNIFYTVLGEISGIGGASVELDRLMAELPPSVRREQGEDILKTFEIFQTLSFAPDEMLGRLKEQAVLKENYAAAQKVISNLITSKEEK